MKRELWEATVYWEQEGGPGLERMGVGCLGVKGVAERSICPGRKNS